MAQSFAQIPPLSEKDKARFFSKVEIDESGCHLWKASKFYHGYGKFKIGNSTRLAHRVAFSIEHGIDFTDKLVMHSCDTPLCVNPYHLSLGTDQDNAQDRENKGRGDQSQGENYSSRDPQWRNEEGKFGASKLTESDVQLIRSDTRSRREIASDFNIDHSHVRKIKNRQVWRHVA